MIIPVRCFTCNKTIGDVYEKYKFLEKKQEIKETDSIEENINQNNKKEIFKELGIQRYCCIRHLISQVDLVEQI